MKNSADQEGCHLPMPKAEVDNTLRDQFSAEFFISYVIRKPNSITALYSIKIFPRS